MNKLIYLVIFSFFSTGIYAQMKDLVHCKVPTLISD